MSHTCIHPHDHIELTGLEVYGYHGVFAEEKATGQPFIVDIICWVDMAAAAASDDVANTVHYGELAELIHGIVAGPSKDLIETVAVAAAEAALAQFPLLEAITVRLHKPKAPIPLNFEDVAVVVHRHQPTQ
ncbi:MAG: dihydroneopterin aldolase [Corynebacterium sp.]|nr:dihydroneopterin aldolase [Corynebacterium sp.]